MRNFDITNPTNKDLHDALEHVLNDAFFIEDRESALLLIEKCLSFKRQKLRHAKKHPPLKPGWFYRPGSKTGWYHNGKRYVWIKDGKVPPQS
jgi:hypothetical protein